MEQKEKLKQFLIERAHNKGFCTYTEVCNHLNLNPDKWMELYTPGGIISRLMDMIDKEDIAENKPFLTSLIVRIDKPRMPGIGFFEMAKQAERFDGRNKEKYWISELKKLYKYYS